MSIISYVEDQQVEVIQRLQLELKDSNHRLTEIAKDRAEIWEEKLHLGNTLLEADRQRAEANIVINKLRKENAELNVEYQRLKFVDNRLNELLKECGEMFNEKMRAEDGLIQAEREQVDLKFEVIQLRKENADLHIELLDCKAGNLSLAAKVEQPVPQADRWGFLPELETTDSSTS